VRFCSRVLDGNDPVFVNLGHGATRNVTASINVKVSAERQ